ncbi:MAG: hypothetical protein WC995_05860 [Lysobacteraceae bacterium]
MSAELLTRDAWHRLLSLRDEARQAADHGDRIAAYVAEWMEEMFAACERRPSTSSEPATAPHGG